MAESVQIGRPYSDLPTVLLALGAAACIVMGAGILVAGRPSVTTGMACLLVAAPLAAFAAGRVVIAARTRRSVTPTDTGFVLRDRRGEFEFSEEDVTDLGTWVKTRAREGEPVRHVRHCHLTLQAEGSAGSLSFDYPLTPGRPDPLADFLARNLSRLTDRARADRAAGRALEGDGWLLDRDGLTFWNGSAETRHPLAELSAAGVVDGRVCVWAVGVERPVVRVPAESPNALILAQVLAPDLAARPPHPGPQDGGLGHLIFERDRSHGWPFVLLYGFGMTFLTAVGIGMLAFGAGDGNVRGVVIGLLMAAVPLPTWYRVWVNRVNVFRGHSDGVCRVTNRGAVELRYDELAGFGYSAVSDDNGVTTTMAFVPENARAFTYAVTRRRPDAALDSLRDHVCRVLSGRMLRRLAGGEAVDWVGGVRLIPQGLEVPASDGMFGRAAGVIPYENIDRYEILESRTFRLFARLEPKAVMSSGTGAVNFYPGYFALQTLLSQRAPSE